MLRNPRVRLVIAAVAGAAGALALLGLLDAVNAGSGFERTTAATAFGWMLPILLGFVCVMLVRALITTGRDQRPSTASRTRRCAACGGSVLDSWRLCPHCGEPLGDEEPEAVTA